MTDPSPFVSGLIVTLELTFVSVGFGLILGLPVAFMRMSGRGVLRLPAQLVISTVLSVPVLIQIFIVFYTLPILTGILLPGFLSVVLTLILNHMVAMAEIYRSGLQSVDRGQAEAAFTLGMSRFQILRFVVVPQAVRLVVPPTTSETIVLIKNTSLATFIGVNDLLNVGRILAVRTFRPVEVLSLIAVVYFALTYPIAIWGRLIERRVRRAS